MNRALSAALTSIALLTLAGCAANPQAEQEDAAKCAAPKPGTVTTVNSMCAIVHNDPVDPSVPAAEWKGQKVGFCCAGCIPKWNKMSPQQKDASLAEAIAAAKKN